MPALPRKQSPEFVALWVEDGAARVWHIDVASGAADEIARLDVEGIARPDVLDLVRHMVRMRYGLAPRAERMADMPQAVLPTPTPAKAEARPNHGRGQRRPNETYLQMRARQLAGQNELYKALASHPAGADSGVIAEQLGRKRTSTGVSLSVLERQGRVRLDRETGLWHALTNGDG